MSEPKTIKIDNAEYVRKDSIRQDAVEFTGEKTIASRMIGKKVLVTVGKFKEQKGIIAQFGEKVDSHILPKTLHYVYVEFPSGEQTKILSIYLKYA